MMFRDKDTGEILTQLDIINKFSNTSFPKEDHAWVGQVLDFANVDRVVEVDKPDDTDAVVYVYGDIVHVNDVWTQQWNATPRYSDEELSLLNQSKIDAKWDNLRNQRNAILSDMDVEITRNNELIKLGYTPYSGPGVYDDLFINAILQYKEQLRQLPSTVTDIDNVIWPVSPFHVYDTYKDQYLTLVEKELQQQQDSALAAEAEAKLAAAIIGTNYNSIEELNG